MTTVATGTTDLGAPHVTPRSAEPAVVVASIRDLRVTFSTPRGDIEAVRGVDLDVHRGECVAIVGESGSGKSVTARSLAGLLPAHARLTSERLEITGDDLRGASEAQWRRIRGTKVGLVLQDALTSLDPLRPLGKEVGEVLQAHRLVRGRKARKTRVVELLGSVGIPAPALRAQQYPHQLSGGLRQRGLIASGLAGSPELLIADEPTTALDVTVQAQVLDLLAARKAEGTTVLLISHDLAVVAQIADYVLVMREGRVLEAGPTATVLADPKTAYTRQLLRAIPSGSSKGYRLSEPGGAPAGGERIPLPPRSIATGTPVITATGLRKDFRHGHTSLRAVDNVSFSIAAGETLGIVGESGSGKTTVARIALGLIAPDAGDIHLGDTPWLGLPERRRRHLRKNIQFIAQDPLSSFDPRYRVKTIVGESLDATQLSKSERAARVHEVLELVGLGAGYADRHPRSLSGGQRQRVSIARALAPRPQLVVADEPASALDVSVQAQILDLLAELQAELGTAILFISHDLGVVHHVADRVLVMKDGRVVEEGEVGEVFHRPQHPYSQALLSALPTLERRG
jgi:peptide/nickel transport system ATP-binding protein